MSESLATIGKFKAAVLVEQRKPLELAEVELPEALGYGQVLVRLVFSGVCGSQLGEIEGVKGEDRYLPHCLGHEGSGYVIETGPGVKTVRSGDAVVLHWRPGKGIESEPPQYTWNGKRLNGGWVTTFNEYAIVSENRMTVIPPDFDLEFAALLGCAVTTGLGIVNNNARLKIGESLVVFGAGGVGLSVIQGAQMVSANPIVAVDLFDSRLELAKHMGATHTLNARSTDLREAIPAILGPAGADVIVDNTGSVDMIELAYSLSAKQGRVILVGVPKKGCTVSIYTLPIHFGKTLIGSHGGEAMPAEDIPRYVGLIQAGRFPLRQLITDRYPLEEINSAIEDMRSGKVRGRCMIALNPGGRS